MKRYLGLDLGTKTCGVAIVDKSGSIIFPKVTIRFKSEDYQFAHDKVMEIVNENNITDIAIGYPKNMDGSCGFASQRTDNFISLFKNDNIEFHKVDERLSSVEAEKLLHEADLKSKDFRDKVDMQAAIIILETYLRSLNGR